MTPSLRDIVRIVARNRDWPCEPPESLLEQADRITAAEPGDIVAELEKIIGAWEHANWEHDGRRNRDGRRQWRQRRDVGIDTQ